MAQSAADTNERRFSCIIADDSKFARLNIGKVVSATGGYIVGEASNGIEAVELFNRLHPDLVFLDITMPELDGLDTLRRIMEVDKSAKVIMVSSLGHKEMLWKAMCLGANHYITKPFKPGYARMIIESVVGTEKEV